MPRPRVRLPEWLFGGGGKLRLLRALFAAGPDRRWRQTELALAAGLERKGSVDEHLAALVELGVLRQQERHYQLDPSSPLAGPLEDLVNALAGVPDRVFERPGRRR
jgi:hypothetical protein